MDIIVYGGQGAVGVVCQKIALKSKKKRKFNKNRKIEKKIEKKNRRKIKKSHKNRKNKSKNRQKSTKIEKPRKNSYTICQVNNPSVWPTCWSRLAPPLVEKIPFYPSDINECNANPCGDNTVCKNTPGGHQCSCRPNFKRQSDGSCGGEDLFDGPSETVPLSDTPR